MTQGKVCQHLIFNKQLLSLWMTLVAYSMTKKQTHTHTYAHLNIHTHLHTHTQPLNRKPRGQITLLKETTEWALIFIQFLLTGVVRCFSSIAFGMPALCQLIVNVCVNSSLIGVCVCMGIGPACLCVCMCVCLCVRAVVMYVFVCVCFFTVCVSPLVCVSAHIMTACVCGRLCNAIISGVGKLCWCDFG